MQKFMSRKFIVTMTVIAATTVLAVFGKVTGDVALVFGAGLAAYNYANAKVEEYRSKDDKDI